MLGDICADSGAEGIVSRCVVGEVMVSSIAEAWRVVEMEALVEEGWLVWRACNWAC